MGAKNTKTTDAAPPVDETAQVVDQVTKDGSVGGESLTTAAPPETERAPNLRLAKTREGSAEREIHEAHGSGEYYPARTYVRARGVEYELPTLPDGSPDVETQKAGFYHDYAHRIASSSPNYERISASRK